MGASYPFKRHRLDWLLVHESRVEPGMRHIKSFVRETRPQEQLTLNLYLAGRFELLAAGRQWELRAGQSSLDLGDLVFQPGELVIERPLETGSVRLCMQPVDPAQKWSRRPAIARAGQVLSARDGFIFPLRPDMPIGIREYMPEQDEPVFLVERM